MALCFRASIAFAKKKFPTGEGWNIAHSPQLECRQIRNKNGTHIGWLLGSGVNPSGHFVVPDELLEVYRQNRFDLLGRYAIILTTAQGRRMNFDSVMDLPAMYNAKVRMIASSPLMALRRALEVNPKLDYRKIFKEGGNYGLQQTRDPDVMRALSNHYLNLDDFFLHRHWPNSYESDLKHMILRLSSNSCQTLWEDGLSGSIVWPT